MDPASSIPPDFPDAPPSPRILQVLYRISEILGMRAGQREMLSEVLDVLERELAMTRGTVMLLCPDGQELVVAAAKDVDAIHHQEVRYRRDEGITGRVVRTGLPVVVPRITEEPEFLDRLHRRQDQGIADVSFICVPIKHETETLGTLAVDVPLSQLEHLGQHQRVLSIVASLIANDVKNRRQLQFEREALETENLRLRDALGERFRPENIVGDSSAMHEVYTRIFQVSASDTTVLIRGESGTGKELVANAIHYLSPRAKRPFVKVNCAALSENLLESELFGHEKGAFTGALFARIGRLEEADKGTLFLDEIGDFSPAIQVKLLRVLQEREFERVGSNRPIQADVRILAATNRNLEELIQARTFRDDLYYRFNVFPILLPPLRERRSDILLLANHFVEKFNRKMGKQIQRISTPAINMMLAYHWPGNVRELENCIEHAVLLSTDQVIHGHNLPPTLQMPAAGEERQRGNMHTQVALLERDLIMDALKRAEGNINTASGILGITSRMVRYKIKALRIDYKGLFKKRRN